MKSVTLIGIGRLGGALAIALSRCGFAVRELIFRSEGPSKAVVESIEPRPKLVPFYDARNIASEIVFITVQDSDIAAVQKALAAKVSGCPTVFHTSGSLSSDVLSDLKALGCATASFHPLVSVSDPVKGSASFAGAFACVEGDQAAVAEARSIAEAIGASSFTIEPDEKALYHAAAMTASGSFTSLIDMSAEMLERCGLTRERGLEILRPLVESTAANIFEQGTAAALTGPFARADAETISRHIDAISKMGDIEVLKAYLVLGERSAAIAESRGVGHERMKAVREILNMAKTRIEC